MTAAIAAQLLITLLQQASSLAPLIQQAMSEGRDLTTAELQTIFGADTAARNKLAADITAAS